jgi:hypothetical protein
VNERNRYLPIVVLTFILAALVIVSGFASRAPHLA